VGLAFLGGLVEAEFGATPDKVTHTLPFCLTMFSSTILAQVVTQ